MATDYADLLRAEATGPHSIFQQFILLLGKSTPDSHFFFFEGSEDPAFYVGLILPRICDHEYHEFICNGRQGVLKLNELCRRDGRAFDRSLYFIDRDHCEFISPEEVLPRRIFQTEHYSFENYLVCNQTFRRFWTERLHLPSGDTRYESHLALFARLHQSFFERMQLLMAIILIGRGIDSGPTAKLNLNNVKLENVLSIEIEAGRVRWAKKGGEKFLAASNITESSIKIRGDAIRKVIRKHLRGRAPKSYIRGKYELWFFVRFLSLITRDLSDRAKARASGLPRATPGEAITHAGAIDYLCALAPCPLTLDQFLKANVTQSRKQQDAAVPAEH